MRFGRIVACLAVLAVDADEPETYDYRVELRLADGEDRIMEGLLRTEESFVNGRGCPPTHVECDRHD